MSRPISELYEFGPFRLDLERRVFTREHQVVPLAPKTFDLLVLLVQRPGHAFSKQELMKALWPDTFIEEANLSFQISVLRKALGEQGARWVETVPKHGYRFAAEVRAPSAEPASGGPSESPSRPPKRGTRNAWLAGAMVATVFLVVLALLTLGRQPHSTAVRTSATLAVPLTAYPGFE
jgi:DNA-binding winged helix-turn-helix (wHTH) protein